MRSARSRVAAGCFATLLALGACTDDAASPDPGATASPDSSAPAGGPEVGGSVVFGVLGEPPTLDPYARRATDLTHALVRPLYPSLFRWDPAGRAVPYLAESLDAVRGGVRVRLTQIRWSDGSPVTARDVVASIRRARPPSGFARIQNVRAAGPRTVLLGGRVEDWESTLATAAYVLPGGRASRPGGRFGGPFVLAGLRSGLQVVYEPNPTWVATGPYLDRLKVQFISGLSFLLELLERGDLDGAAVPSSVNLGERLAARDIEYAEALGWESVYLDFRSSGLDRGGRRAFVAAVDRGVLSEGIVRGDGRISNTLHPEPGAGGSRGPFGRAGGGSITGAAGLLTGPGGDELVTLTQRIIQRQIERAGGALQIASAEPSAVYGGGRGDPGGVKVLRSGGVPGVSDPPGAVRTLHAYPLFHVETVIAFGAALKGVEVNPTIEGPLWNAELWWLGAP